jgi:hypothetical protein
MRGRCVQADPDSPERFRMEMLFSNGANYAPTDRAHLNSTKPRVPIHRDDKLWLADFQEHLSKWGTLPASAAGAGTLLEPDMGTHK